MKRHQRILLACTTALLFAQISLASSNNMPTPRNTSVKMNSIVATVNDDIITESDLQKQIQLTKAQLLSRHISLPPADNLRHSILQQMINTKLQLGIAKNNGIKATPEQVNAYLKNLANSQHMSIDQLQAQFKKQGLSASDLKKNIANQIIIMTLQHSALSKSIKPTTAERRRIKQQIQQTQQNEQHFNIEDINISLPSQPSANQKRSEKKIAKEVIARLKQGKKIQPSASIKINNMGWKNANQLPNLFVAALNGKQAGAIIGPISAGNGLHVLKLIDTKTTSSVSAPTNTQIEQQVMQEQYSKALFSWLKTLRNNAYIKINS